MSTLSKPSVQTTLRYVLTYVLFGILALGGLFIMVRLRGNIQELSAFIGIDARLIRDFNTWSNYLLFVPYLVFLIWLEAFMHKGAQMNKIWRRAGIVFGVEVVTALLTGLLTLLLTISPRF